MKTRHPETEHSCADHQLEMERAREMKRGPMKLMLWILLVIIGTILAIAYHL